MFYKLFMIRNFINHVLKSDNVKSSIADKFSLINSVVANKDMLAAENGCENGIEDSEVIEIMQAILLRSEDLELIVDKDNCYFQGIGSDTLNDLLNSTIN